MFMCVQPQPDMAGQDLILLLAELCVDLFGRAPHGRTMFLAVSCPSSLRVIQTQAHNVGASANEDGQQTLVRPLDLEWMLQRGSQLGQKLRQAAAHRLRNEQRCPDDRDIEEKAQNQVALFGCLFQAIHLRENKIAVPSADRVPLMRLLRVIYNAYFTLPFLLFCRFFVLVGADFCC